MHIGFPWVCAAKRSVRDIYLCPHSFECLKTPFIPLFLVLVFFSNSLLTFLSQFFYLSTLVLKGFLLGPYILLEPHIFITQIFVSLFFSYSLLTFSSQFFYLITLVLKGSYLVLTFSYCLTSHFHHLLTNSESLMFLLWLSVTKSHKIIILLCSYSAMYINSIGSVHRS